MTLSARAGGPPRRPVAPPRSPPRPRRAALASARSAWRRGGRSCGTSYPLPSAGTHAGLGRRAADGAVGPYRGQAAPRDDGLVSRRAFRAEVAEVVAEAEATLRGRLLE